MKRHIGLVVGALGGIGMMALAVAMQGDVVVMALVAVCLVLCGASLDGVSRA